MSLEVGIEKKVTRRRRMSSFEPKLFAEILEQLF
jgi:hypothetical protein